MSDDWQKYDAENENSLSYFVGKKEDEQYEYIQGSLGESICPNNTFEVPNYLLQPEQCDQADIQGRVFDLGSNMLFLFLIDACCKRPPTK